MFNGLRSFMRKLDYIHNKVNLCNVVMILLNDDRVLVLGYKRVNCYDIILPNCTMHCCAISFHITTAA